MSREERVGPALMVGLASSNAGALVLLAQDGAQASADEAVEDAGWRGMLEVAKPSPKHRVEVGDNPLEAVAPAADRPRPHLVLAMPVYKSAQSGLVASINAIFQPRRHSFSCFSRVIAATALSSISK